MATEVDSIPMMRQLAAMAKMDLAPIKRMVLVLDVNEAPTLFVESFIDSQSNEPLVETALTVKEEPMVIDTTTMQNKFWRSKQPKPKR